MPPGELAQERGAHGSLQVGLSTVGQPTMFARHARSWRPRCPWPVTCVTLASLGRNQTNTAPASTDFS